MGWGYGWRPYVPVAQRRAQAVRQMDKLRKKGHAIAPVEVEGRKIAHSFWGRAWCEHLEKFSDYENRLPRGRTYVRNGSVCHLGVSAGKLDAWVSGSDLYKIAVTVKKLPKDKWGRIKERCAGQIGSLLDLLQGRLSDSVMEVVTDRDDGLFPHPNEIGLQCSCPDWAVMCKHVAAVMYGVGVRLDEKPELLFTLRGVDHQELIAADSAVAAALAGAESSAAGRILSDDALSGVFGIELDGSADAAQERPMPKAAGKAAAKKKPRKTARSKTAAAKTAKAKSAVRKPARKKTKPAARKAAPQKAKPAAHKATVKITAAPKRPASVAKIKSGRDVRKLRAKFGLNKTRFAKLAGVSGPTVTLWETAKGPLNLTDRTRRSLNTLAGLSASEARGRLEAMG